MCDIISLLNKYYEINLIIMESNSNKNPLLKEIQVIFKEYAEDKENILKQQVRRLLFENKLIDIQNCDLFYFSNLMDKLSPSSDLVNYEQFLRLIFYTFCCQIKYSSNEDESEIPELYLELEELDRQAIYSLAENKQLIFSSSNILRVLSTINDDLEITNINISNRSSYFLKYQICIPSFSSFFVDHLINKESLDYLGQYSFLTYKLFTKYSKQEEDLNLSYISLLQLHKLIHASKIPEILDSGSIVSVLSNFLSPNNLEKVDELEKIMESSLPERELISLFQESDIDSKLYNFSFSTFFLILAMFAYKSNENNPSESEEKAALTNFHLFFDNILAAIKLENDLEQKELEEQQLEEVVPVIKEDESYKDASNYPESTILQEAIKIKLSPSEEEEYFIQEKLLSFNDLPDIPTEIRSMMNPEQNQSNKVYCNPAKFDKVKFPMNTQQIELDEMEERKQEDKLNAKIEAARKGKKANARDPPPKTVFYEDAPNLELENLKYFGKKPYEGLKKRNLKFSFKETVHLSAVHPSLIKEVLVLPKSIPLQVTQIVVSALSDSTQANFELAIRKFEKAQKDYSSFRIISSQVDLFFNLSYGSLYESLDLNFSAFKYYTKAKEFSDKSYIYDPDTALVYCYLGSLMVRLRQHAWAFRMFAKAKDIRENSIGGDTLDTATVYNNLGVCCYHLNAFYPAKGYFELAYQIYKELLGDFHQRTITIKNNLSINQSLNFNVPFEYKSAPIYETVRIVKDNAKKAKK